MSFVVVYLISNIVSTIAIERFMSVFFSDRRTSAFITVASYLFRFILSSLIFLLFNIPFLTLVTSLIVFYLITLNYESSIIKRLVAVISTLFFLTLVELFVILLFDRSFESILIGFEPEILMVATIGLISLLLSLLFKNFKNIKIPYRATFTQWLSITLIPLSSLFVFILVLFAADIPQIVAIIFLIVMLGINLFATYFYDALSRAHEENLKIVLGSKEKDYYISQCEIMKNSVEQLKSFRHDVKIHLATLRDLSLKSNTREIIGYLDLLLGDVEKSEIYSDTGNLPFDSIINFKLKNASKDNIKLNLNVLIPPVINIEIVDVITILGNLLDNALNAVKELDEKWITLNIQFSKGTLFLKIENPFDGALKFKDDSGGKLASIKHGGEHGYGLRNVKKSVDKYNGEIKISTANNIFSVNILLFIHGSIKDIVCQAM